MIDHLLHLGLFAPCELPVRLIGVGGVGAITALMLAKMSDGEIFVYDDDLVDEVNLATQFYRPEDIGENKANSIAKIANQFSDTAIFTPISARYPTAVHKPAWLVISAVDTIKSRKSIWQDMNGKMDWQWYLDARMGSERFDLYSLSRQDIEWYTAHLSQQSDETIPDEPCTAKATFYTAAIAAGHIGKTIRKILAGIKPPLWMSHDIYQDHIVVADRCQGKNNTPSEISSGRLSP